MQQRQESEGLFTFLVAEKQKYKIRLGDAAQINAVAKEDEHRINLISPARKQADFCKACVTAAVPHIGCRQVTRLFSCPRAADGWQDRCF